VVAKERKVRKSLKERCVLKVVRLRGGWETIPDYPAGYYPEIGQKEEIQGDYGVF